MRISVLLTDGAKQVMLTPETDHEKQALKMIAPTDKIEAVSKWGRYDHEPQHAGIHVAECQGEYFREFSDGESLMFIIRPEKKK
jgi:hypothetical protein